MAKFYRCDRCQAEYQDTRNQTSPVSLEVYGTRGMKKEKDLCPKCVKAVNEVFEEVLPQEGKS